MNNIPPFLKSNFSLKDWLTHIQNVSSIFVNLNLDRMKLIAKELKLLPFKRYTVLVGGTNGKGTTCYLLEKILLNHNIRVGLYTSPHLFSYRERIRICGQELSDDIHIKSFSMIEKVRSNMVLTYFEFATLSALYIFKQFKLDLVILEVGLGGRLDATNIINPNISVITNIAIDHVDFLGNTRRSIAIEKAGIFRENKPAIIGELSYPSIVDEIAEYKNVILFLRGRDWNFYCYENTWIWVSYDNNNQKLLSNLPMPNIPLENAAVVLSILYWLPFSIYKKLICYALKDLVVFGRFQIISYAPLVILDVGHNPSAAFYVIMKLSSIILKRPKFVIVRAVIGMLKNKDIKNTIYILSKLVNVWYYANLNTSLSADFEEIYTYFSDYEVKCFENITNAWYQAFSDSSANDCILVFGSFYAVEPVIKSIFKIKVDL